MQKKRLILSRFHGSLIALAPRFTYNLGIEKEFRQCEQQIRRDSMNISQLETLLTISKTMSFRKAGELLNLTQPAVSAQIKSLEDEFKTVLVDRNQPVTLTDPGKVFLEHAERILDVVEELRQKLTDLKEVPQGQIIMGTTTSIAIQILPRVLSYFQDQFPLIKTSIQSMPSSAIYQQVESGLIDVGIGYLIERNPNLSTSILYYDTFELVVSPHHPLASRPQATMEALREIPLILLSPDTVGRRFVDDVFKKFNIEPHVVMELSSSEEVKRMVEINTCSKPSAQFCFDMLEVFFPFPFYMFYLQSVCLVL